MGQLYNVPCLTIERRREITDSSIAVRATVNGGCHIEVQNGGTVAGIWLQQAHVAELAETLKAVAVGHAPAPPVKFTDGPV